MVEAKVIWVQISYKILINTKKLQKKLQMTQLKTKDYVAVMVTSWEKHVIYFDLNKSNQGIYKIKLNI